MNDSARTIETSDEDGVRYLHFGSEWVQGAMRIARPFALELEYTREMMLALALRHEAYWPRRVLQVGLGAASIAKFLYRQRPRSHQTIVEIDPGVARIAAQRFRLPDDPARLALHFADGVAWMKTDRHAYDLIVVDGYDRHARFGALGTEDFYRDCRARLNKGGLLTLNLFGRARGYARQLAALENVFGARVLALPANDDGNAIVFATVGAALVPDLPSLEAACTQLARETGIKWGASLVRLRRALSQCKEGHKRAG